MKKKNFRSLKLNKKSVSKLTNIKGGLPPPDDRDTLAPNEPVEPSGEETIFRMCSTTIFTTWCPTAFCY